MDNLDLVIRVLKKGSGAQEAANELSGLEGKVKGLSSAMQALAGSAAVGAVIAGLKYAVGEAMAARQAMAQTEAVIRSTGGAAGLSAGQVAAMAGDLERLTSASAETIQEGQNMLLTFKEIKGDTFERATTAMLDMAVAMNKGSLESLDLQSASIQLGKALNDPIKGVTALTKVGVSFTEQQKAQIKAMVEAGDVAGAQALILTELESEFGGAAKAAGDAAGPLKKWEVIIGNVAEAIGEKLLPWIEGAAEGFLNLTKVVIIGQLKMAELRGEITTQELQARAAALANDDLAGAIFGVEDAAADAITSTQNLAVANQELETSEEDLKAQLDANRDAIGRLNEVMAGAVGKELREFAEKQTELKDKAQELKDKIGELENKKYLTAEQKTQLEDLRGDLKDTNEAIDENATAHEDATKRILFSILQQQAAVDGFTNQERDALITIAEKWGLVDNATATATKEIGTALSEASASGNWDPFYAKLDEAKNKLLGIHEEAKRIPTQIDVDIYFRRHTVGDAPPEAGDIGLPPDPDDGHVTIPNPDPDGGGGGTGPFSNVIGPTSAGPQSVSGRAGVQAASGGGGVVIHNMPITINLQGVAGDLKSQADQLSVELGRALRKAVNSGLANAGRLT